MSATALNIQVPHALTVDGSNLKRRDWLPCAQQHSETASPGCLPTGPRGDRAALAPAATIADGLATVYVMDAARASSEQDGAWQTPKTLQSHG